MMVYLLAKYTYITCSGSIQVTAYHFLISHYPALLVSRWRCIASQYPNFHSGSIQKTANHLQISQHPSLLVARGRHTPSGTPIYHSASIQMMENPLQISEYTALIVSRWRFTTSRYPNNQLLFYPDDGGHIPQTRSGSIQKTRYHLPISHSGSL